MINWYEMPGVLDNFELNPAYHEKLAIDADIEPVRNMVPANKQAFRQIDCSWVKKRKYKGSEQHNDTVNDQCHY